MPHQLSLQGGQHSGGRVSRRRTPCAASVVARWTRYRCELRLDGDYRCVGLLSTLRIMSLLSLTQAGLGSLAGFCEAASTKVAVRVNPVDAASSFQPTVAAVKGIHRETELAGGVLAERMLSTSVHVITASAGYSNQDVEATGALNGLVL